MQDQQVVLSDGLQLSTTLLSVLPLKGLVPAQGREQQEVGWPLPSQQAFLARWPLVPLPQVPFVRLRSSAVLKRTQSPKVH
jgi:hypothetical protein